MAVARAFSVSPVVVNPPVTGPSFWVDASNYTSNLTDQGCRDLKSQGVVGVIIQAITGNDGISYTRQQLAACLRNGLRVQGYIWCFPGSSYSSINSRLSFFDGYPIESLWLDVEQAGVSISDVDNSLAWCDNYIGKLSGIYSGRWYFSQQGWLGLTKWSDRSLWDSNYDGVPIVESDFKPYGGWIKPVIKQYKGTSAIGHVQEIDLNVASFGTKFKKSLQYQ